MLKKLAWFTIGPTIIVLAIAYAVLVADRGEGVPRENIDSSESSELDDDAPESVEYVVEEVVSGLEVPWGIVFTSADRMLVTERPGRLRVVESGQLRPEPLKTFTDVSTRGEEGLISIALDPNYEQNRQLYVCLATDSGENLAVKVVRYKDQGASLSEETVIIDSIPAARYHAGCELGFGPDGKLYITTGDAFDRQLAQRLDSLAGKILRINPDGSIPTDNPFPNSPIWSYGHRNPQGIDWDASGQLWSSEHGPSVIDGPRGGDEMNKIMRGGNYGWPLVSHEKTQEGTIAPVELFTPAEAPASLEIYTGNVLPQFTGNFFFGALVGEGLVRMVPRGDDFEIAKLPEVQFGRIREVVEGPDGFLYFSTSNRDGRGEPVANDDRIFRIRPE